MTILTAKQAESTRLRGDIKEMKSTLKTSENRLLEVTERANRLDAEIIQTRQIREGADRDLLQALETTEKLASVVEENKDLWNVVRPLAEHSALPEDVGKEWPELLPVLPQRVDDYVFNVVKACTQSLLAQIRVTKPGVDVEKLANPIPPGLIAEAIEAAMEEVDDAAYRIMVQMALPRGPEYGVLINRDQLDQVAHDQELRLDAVAIGVPKAGSIYDTQSRQVETG